MNTKKKQLFKNIQNGKNLEEALADSIGRIAENYYSQALVCCAMKYYTLYEMVLEGHMPAEEQKEELERVNAIITQLFNGEAKADLTVELASIREEITGKMDVLTCYTDQLMVYEYILNRVEHQFDSQKEPETDDTVFIQKLLQYMFGVKDNFVIHERIKEVIGQVPVRMARTRFYELVKDSISLYRNTDRPSLDTYLYMLRTSGALYKPVAEGTYSRDMKEVLSVFQKTDFENMSKDDFKNKSALLVKTGQKIKDVSDYLISFQEIVNYLYVYVLTKDLANGQENEKNQVCFTVLKEIVELFSKKEYKEIPNSVQEYLFQLEGYQESLGDQAGKLEGILEQDETIQIGNDLLEKEFEMIKKANKLMSASIFVNLDVSEEGIADEAVIKEETDKIILEFKELFENSSIRFIRAVIANTISKMPTFFQSADEITEYITNSFRLCRDKAEKQSSMEILMDIMADA